MDELIWKQDAIDAMLGDKVEITNVIRAIGNVRDFEVLNTTCDRHAEIIKALPTAQPVNDDLIQKIEEGIKATGTADEYSVGMCNGMRWCKSLLDGKEPKYDTVQSNYRKAFSVACELLIGANLFGTTVETMFKEIMEKEGIVSSLGYEKYILENLARLTGEDDGTD